MNQMHYILEDYVTKSKTKYTSMRGRLGRDRMVVGSTTTYAISAYHH